ncbi:nuclease [Pseudooceanicola sediminis]|uniref:Nuclease n=1 Tax=Pseudooceanicola sediminis TaxID=2211117 RepID=A0A399IZL8_9RHOB|nr:DinB family protein [Pseudooceanicola sediminis]KAA2313561.1 nuclease [Puniceibacterium sp. HSS470]RII38593.1 nuclease [Pseudooceanicola sediminis]
MTDISKPYRMMALNNAWANATLYGAMTPMEAAVFAAPRPGFFASLKATMNHIHQVDLFYIDALEEGGVGRGVYDRPLIANVADLASAQAEADMRLARLCSALSAATLAQTRQTMRPDGPCVETVEALLLHLFQHQIHHRGQAHVQLQEAGVSPPQLDEFYLDFDRAPSAEAYFNRPA